MARPSAPAPRTRWSTAAAALGGAAFTGLIVALVPDRGRRSARPGGSGPSSSASAGGSDSGGDAASPSRQRAATAPAPDDPRKPEGPEDMHAPGWRYSLRKVGREFGADHCTDLAASLVYYSVLALFPALLAIVSVLGLLGQTGTVETAVFGLIGTKSAVVQVVKPIIDSFASPAAPAAFVIGLVGAIWSASGYVGAFGRAMNRVYDIDEGRPIWKLRPTQLGVTVVVLVLVTVGGLLLALSGDVARTVGDAVGLGPTFVLVFGIVKWPVLVVIAVAAIAILYYFSPNIRQPKFKWTSTGSLIALVALVVASVGFSVYVANFSHYNKTYGTLGGVIAFLLWLWIANLALLFGAEFDAETERARELQAGIAAEEQIQLPPRDARGSDKRAAKHDEDVAIGRRLRESGGRDD